MSSLHTQMLRDITTSGSAVINTGVPIPISSCLRHSSEYRRVLKKPRHRRRVQFDAEGMFGFPPPWCRFLDPEFERIGKHPAAVLVISLFPYASDLGYRSPFARVCRRCTCFCGDSLVTSYRVGTDRSDGSRKPTKEETCCGGRNEYSQESQSEAEAQCYWE